MQKGYYNLYIKKGDGWKAAFRTHKRHYEPTVITFGLANISSIFQYIMNDIFKDLIGIIVIIYLDNILIFSQNKEEHVEHSREVLQHLRENDLYCKLQKCKFFKTKVEYLDMIIASRRIEIEKKKVQVVLDWPVPKKVKDIQAFLEFTNFY